VTGNATVQLFNNTYQVDPALVGRRVELVYDPFDMARPLKVNDRGRPAGQAVVVEIRRHSHRKADAARKDEAGPDTAPATGVDYLRLLRDDHVASIAARGIDYTTLAADAPPDAGARPAADADAEEDR
jgi:putative transposase